MDTINYVKLVGTFADDVLTKSTPTGKTVANFTVITGDKAKNYTRVVAWEELAEQITFGKAGEMVQVQGRIQNRSYMNRENQKQYITEVIATDVQLLSEQKPVTVTQSAEPQADREIDISNLQF